MMNNNEQLMNYDILKKKHLMKTVLKSQARIFLRKNSLAEKVYR